MDSIVSQQRLRVHHGPLCGITLCSGARVRVVGVKEEVERRSQQIRRVKRKQLR